MVAWQTSLHIYTDQTPEAGPYAFASFSPGWQTCVNLPQAPREGDKAARRLSKQTQSPVLLFQQDEDAILFAVYGQGRVVSVYADDPLTDNKRVMDIAALFSLPEGEKRKALTIFRCIEPEKRITLLEEYLGVCLTYMPESAPRTLCRSRGQALYQQYLEDEKRLSGKDAPLALQLVQSYAGSLYDADPDTPFSHLPRHFFFFRNADRSSQPSCCPVLFASGCLTPAQPVGDPVSRPYPSALFQTAYRPMASNLITFTQDAPEAFRGQMMTAPTGFIPVDFTREGYMMFTGEHKLCFADSPRHIAAKLPVKGNYYDINDDYILIYLYKPHPAPSEPNIFIYQLQRQ